jgi:N4-gp56 family major capsid protein
MAYTTTAELGDTIPTIIEKALLISQFNAIMAGVSWNKTKGKGKGSTVNVPYFSEVAANTLTEGVDMVSAEQMEDTNVQITLNEVGCKIVLTDNALEDDAEELKSVAGKILGMAMEKKRDQDLLGQLDDGTNSLCGANTALTMGHVAAARSLLAGNPTSAGGPAPLPYVCVLHPFVTLDLVDVVTPIVPTATYFNVTGTAFTDDILKNYSVAQLFGMRILEDGNLTIDSSDDTKGGAFAAGEGGAILLATARDWDVKPERDESLRGWELNCVGRYGVGEYKAGWIVELYSDASTPT